jgi:hypothetical protein
MEVVSVAAQQVTKDLYMPELADVFFIPQRVVQNDQDVWVGVQHGEKIV